MRNSVPIVGESGAVTPSHPLTTKDIGVSKMANKIKHKRTLISKKLRFEVFKRDFFKCQYCGAHPPAVVLECDHIRPVADGGLNDIDNLVTSCEPCNRGKGARLLTSVPQSLSDKAADIAEREAQIAGYQAILASKRERLETEAYEILNMFCQEFTGMDGIPKRDFTSIKYFLNTIGFDEVYDATEIAIAKDFYNYNKFFRYFCGVCWRKIKTDEEVE